MKISSRLGLIPALSLHFLASTFSPLAAQQDMDGEHDHSDHASMPHMGAPIGVMGDHMVHEVGGWMLSYRYMRMKMGGNRIGTTEVSPETIATTVGNPFFGMPMQPPTLRVVPTDMTMGMHMVGAMTSISDRLTVAVMAVYLQRKMDHITFMGPAGTTRLGTFTTKTDGFGDTFVNTLIKLHEDDMHQLHLDVGLSVPTGSITKTDDVLTPTGATPTLRLPYAMQNGSGTVDFAPGITYTAGRDDFRWGLQYSGRLRLGRNDEGYRLGNRHQVSLWAGYKWLPWLSTTLRVTGEKTGNIEERDPMIVAPVQTADPLNYGGETIETFFEISVRGQEGIIEGHRFAVEFGLPVYQNLNGPQMERDYRLILGWQKDF